MEKIEELKKIFFNRGYNLLSKEYSNNKQYLLFEKDGYYFWNTYNGFLKTDNFKKWSKRNPYSLINLALYLKRVGAKCEIISEEYDYDRVELKCFCEKHYFVSIHNLLVKKQFCCPCCGRKKSAQAHRKDEKYLKILDEYELTLVDSYEGCRKNLYMLTNDGYYIKSSLYSISRGANIYDTVFNVVNKYSFDNMKHWLSLNLPELELISKEYFGAKENYDIKCSCGEIYKANWKSLRLGIKTRCPKCQHSISKIELLVQNWLIEHHVDFLSQYSFEECRNIKLLRFDFYVPALNLCIEVDGEQHFKPVSFNGDKNAANENYMNQKKRDEIKNIFCEEHKIKLLRIPFYLFETEKYKRTLAENILN